MALRNPELHARNDDDDKSHLKLSQAVLPCDPGYDSWSEQL